jgi:hypothetical protein
MDEDKIISALLSLFGSLIGTLVVIRIFFWTRAKEFELRMLDGIKETLKENKANLSVYRAYADPLRDAALSLKYRLSEILSEAFRAKFLLSEAPQTPYTRYKFVSTLYRMAAVLGWIRAYRRERSYLDPLSQASDDAFEEAVNNFQSKLADGPHVEITRAKELISIWVKGTQVPVSSDALSRIALAVESELDKILGQSEAVRTSILEASKEEQLSLCSNCRKIIELELGTEIPDGLRDSRLQEAIAILGITEAWIFRDWQQAIGDFMLQDLREAARRFDVIGFRDFIERYRNSFSKERHHDRELLGHLEALFRDLDLSKVSIFDARREQLQEVHAAIERLVGEIDMGRQRFGPNPMVSA